MFSSIANIVDMFFCRFRSIGAVESGFGYTSYPTFVYVCRLVSPLPLCYSWRTETGISSWTVSLPPLAPRLTRSASQVDTLVNQRRVEVVKPN